MQKDGEVVISTALDNSELEKQLQNTKKKIAALEEELSREKQEQIHSTEMLVEAEKKAANLRKEIEGRSAGRSSLQKQLDEEEAQLQKASAAIAEYKRKTAGLKHPGYAEDSVVEAIEQRRRLGSNIKVHQGKLRAYDDITEQITQKLQNEEALVRSIAETMEQHEGLSKKLVLELEQQETAAGELTRELAKAATQGSRMGEAVDTAGVYLEKFTRRVKNLARRVFIFTIITGLLRSLRDWLGRVVRTNSEASGAVAKLRGALLTLAQPLVSIVIPAFTFLVKVLTRLVSAAAQLFSWLFGKNIADTKKAASSLYQETEALDAMGESAEKAQRSLAGFDELNVLPGKENMTAEVDTSAPDFDFDAALSEEQLKNILGLVKAAAAGLLAWKLADSLLDGLRKFAGLLLAINGGIGLVKATMDAWTNGVTWDNLLAMLGRGAELTAGLALAFGKMGAGVGLVITGITLLVTAFHDAAQNGWNLQNTLMAIAGIISAGLGIALLTGSWIPLLIAGIAALLLAVVNACGNGEELIADLKNILTGFLDFLTGVFTGDFEKALDGLKKMFKNVWNIIVVCFESAINIIIKGLNWLIEKLNSIHFEVPEWVPGVGGKRWGIHLSSISEVKLPRLATGTVVPPNREFLAMLGDNKREPEIVSPVSAMKEAFLSALRESGGSPNPGGKVTLVLDGRVLGEFVIGYINGVTETTDVCPILV